MFVTAKELLDYVQRGMANFDMPELIGRALEGLGYKKKVWSDAKKDCSAYVSEDSDYVFMFLDNKNKGIQFPLLIDKDTYETYGDNGFYLKSFHNDKDYAPMMGVALLHTVICECEEGFEVDHITSSTRICIKEALRQVTAKQNRRHVFNYTKVDDKYGKTFSGLYTIESAELIEQLKAQGYKVKSENGSYRVTSPIFTDKDALYEAINELENTLLGEYRYNPIEGCDKSDASMYLYMIWKLYGVNDEVYYEAKRQLFIEEKGTEMAKYYGLI